MSPRDAACPWHCRTTEQAFGTGACLSQAQYHQYESGKRRLSLDAGLALCNAYGLTLDWLFRGDMSGLPMRLATEIRERGGSPPG